MRLRVWAGGYLAKLTREPLEVETHVWRAEDPSYRSLKESVSKKIWISKLMSGEICQALLESCPGSKKERKKESRDAVESIMLLQYPGRERTLPHNPGGCTVV